MFVVKKSCVRRLLGRPMRKWENNIKISRKEMRCDGVDLASLRIGISGELLRAREFYKILRI
jgi:hypothetical protein